MAHKAEERRAAERLLAAFRDAGAEIVEADVLQPAETLLDLYGEDIRARAYVTTDPLRGEQMLRPDFTVPVVQMHMASGAAPARYTYSGEVFRRQEDDPGRPSEYLQVGFEIFNGAEAEDADAEVFALFQSLLAPYNLRAATGDIGILMAATRGLETSERRRDALLRHIWRPRRYRALLDRFTGRTRPPESRSALIRLVADGGDPFPDSVTEIGLRGPDEVRARIDALVADAAEPPIAARDAALIDDILSLRAMLPDALSRLHDISVDMPAIRPAVQRLARRIDALSQRGVDVDSLPFEASYGRTQMEYYDGFVFGFSAPFRPDLSPIATGGRYDALTRRLGEGRAAPAVGGVIRPGLIVDLTEPMT